MVSVTSASRYQEGYRSDSTELAQAVPIGRECQLFKRKLGANTYFLESGDLFILFVQYLKRCTLLAVISSLPSDPL